MMTPNEEPQLCECGCGKLAKPGNRFIQGHNSAWVNRHKPKHKPKHKHQPKPEPQLCKCGCGELANPGRDYIAGHQNIGRQYRNLNQKPLKNTKISTNKECPLYLGCYIAEQVLSKVFKDVQVMPYKNPGYDFICGKGLKIDVKSAATGYKNNSWRFLIRKNKIADYFLCIAFENRNDLIPTHLWLIPGKDINHLTGIKIRKTTLRKWHQYEQSLDKVIVCCDEMKSNHKLYKVQN